MKLSVIIPCYNSANTLRCQLDALTAQRWSEPWEVLLVDNGSQDSSIDVARSYQGKLPNFRIIDASARRGVAYVRNMGANAAKADRFAICDADDMVEDNWVSAMGEALRHYHLVAGRLCFDKFNPKKIAEQRSKPWAKGLPRQIFKPFAFGCNLGVSRYAHELVEGFDENLKRVEDLDYSWRIQLKGLSLYYEPDAVVQYRIANRQFHFSKQYRFHQAAGESHYLLYKRYGPLAMLPRLSKNEIIRRWLVLAKRMPFIWRRKNHKRILIDLSTESGYLSGCIKGYIKSLAGEKWKGRKK